MTSHNNAQDFVELKTIFGRRQMKLHQEMLRRNDWPANDCQLFVNMGNMIHDLAEDWTACNSNIAQIAINQKAMELMERMCDAFDGTAVQQYIRMLNDGREQAEAIQAHLDTLKTGA